MNILWAILILVVLIAIYIMAYLLNQKIKKPENCKGLDCEGCNLDCYRKEKNHD